MWARLEDQINPNFCETLGHKNTLPNVSNPCPKVGFWLTFASNSSRVKCLEENEPPGCFPLGYTASQPATPPPADYERQNEQSLAAMKLTNQILEKNNPINQEPLAFRLD